MYLFSDSPHIGRSIWDMPVTTPTTPNPAITREQQEQQLLHNQQQHLLQQQDEQKMNHHQGWDQVRAGLMEDNTNQQPQHQGWPSHHRPHQQQEPSQQSKHDYNDQQPSNNAHQEFDHKTGGNEVDNDARNISTIDSFRTETTSNDNNDLLSKNNFSSTNNSSKPKESKKDKKEKGNKKDGNNKKNNNSSNIEKSSNQPYQDSTEGNTNYIPGMEGTVKPDVPITATKSLEEEQQQRAQADALYRLQVCIH